LWKGGQLNLDGEVIVSKLLEGETLSHYGIKDQKWGVRRFQNEDGSLTPEGRERYGLKGGLSSMSDDDLRKAISKKQTENNYIRLQTEQARRHQANVSGFIKELTGTISTATNPKLQDVYLNKYKKQVVDDNTNLQTKKEAALKAGNKEKATEYDKIIKMNNDSLKSIGDAITTTGKVSEELGKQSNLAGKILTRGELKEAQDRAYRNIAEMDEKQLKSVVDRMLLEEQYKNLIDPPKPTKLEKGREWLQTAGSILGVTLTALTIAGMFKGEKIGKIAKHADDSDNYLEHYGVRGMRKGIRRWTNPDGSLTEEGKIHYGLVGKDYKKHMISNSKDIEEYKKGIKPINSIKKKVLIGSAITASLLGAFGTYKLIKIKRGTSNALTTMEMLSGGGGKIKKEIIKSKKYIKNPKTGINNLADFIKILEKAEKKTKFLRGR